jgi:hypothetical protein
MRATLPAEVLASIPMPTLHTLFAAVGYPPGITPSATSHAAVATALRTKDIPPALARALFVIGAFAVEAGRIDVYNAATALAYAKPLPDATSPADLVAQLLARATKDAAIAELIDAAKILRDRAFRPRATGPLARHHIRCEDRTPLELHGNRH